MKFTLAWLKEHLDTSATLEEITFALTDLGLEVEGVTNPGEAPRRLHRRRGAGGRPAPRRRQAPRLPRPDRRRREADRLRRPQRPRRHQGGDLQARRLHPRHRHHHQGRQDPRRREPRHDALRARDAALRRPRGHRRARRPTPPSAPATSTSSPSIPVIDVAITPNRPDALGVAGIARDLAARGLGTLITPAVEPVPGGFPCPVAVYLAPDVAGEACPLFVGRLIRGVRNGPSPQWLQDRLRAIGLRPISALVDITNFITYDRNRPLHVFDADKLHGPDHRPPRPPRRDACAPSTASDYAFDGSETLVCDATGPESIGGVMGGLRTGCHRGHHQRLRRGGVLRPHPHRPHRPPPPRQLRRPLPLRARRRPRLHPLGHRARHRA